MTDRGGGCVVIGNDGGGGKELVGRNELSIVTCSVPVQLNDLKLNDLELNDLNLNDLELNDLKLNEVNRFLCKRPIRNLAVRSKDN